MIHEVCWQEIIWRMSEVDSQCTRLKKAAVFVRFQAAHTGMCLVRAEDLLGEMTP